MAAAAANWVLKFLPNDAGESEGLADPKRAKIITKALRQLGKNVRELLRKHASMSQQEAEDLSELGKFFAMGAAMKKSPDPKAEEDLTSVIVYRPKSSSRTPPKRGRPDQGKESGASGDEASDVSQSSGGTGEGQTGGGENSNETSGGATGASNEGTKGGDNSESGDGSKGKTGLKPGSPVALYDTRTLIPSAGKNFRTVLFTPSKSGLIELSVSASGLSNAVPLVIHATDRGTIRNGKVLLNVTEDKRASITVQMSQNYDGPVEIEANGAK